MSDPLPEGWRLAALTELGSIDRGRSRHRPRYAEHLYGGPHPFIQTGDIKNSGGRITSHEQTYSEAGLAQSRLWPAGTLCITIAANIAETAILTYPACFPDSVVGFIADASVCDVRFVEYSVRAMRRRIQHQASGSVQDNINLAVLRSLRLPVPPLEEQERIADILSSLDDKIELNRCVSHTLESIARAIFKSWFVDLDPVHQRTEHNNAEPWPKVPFSETVHVLSGGTPRTSEPEFWGGGLPWYSVADAPSDGDVFVTDTKKTISSAGVESSAAKLVPGLTTIVSARGTVGKCALTGREMAFNQSCYGLRPMDSVGYYFTYFSTRNLVEELRRSAHGSVFSTITRDTLTGVCVRRPPSDLVAAFEREVGPLMQRILLGVEQSKSLTLTRDALLSRLVSGDLAAPGVTGLQAIGGQ